MRHSAVVIAVLASQLGQFLTPVFAAGDETPLPTEWLSPCFDGQTVHFRSGFEGSSQILSVVNGQRASLQSLERIDACGGQGWAQMPQDIHIGKASIEFQGGTESQRRAQVIPFPGELTNHALQFWLQRPNALGSKPYPVIGRIQMVISGNRGIRKLVMSVRMYLDPSFNFMRSLPGTIDWMTISEWWNNPSWTQGEKFPFRIGVNLVKTYVGINAPLYFKVHAQTFSTVRNSWDRMIWSQINKKFLVPVGRWVTLEYGFVEGNEETGRFFLAATVQGGQRVTIFDIKGYTHHPNDPNPDGLSEFNPMKLYTSSRVIDYVRSKGGALQIFWDDFNLAACNQNGPCAIQ